MANTANPTVDAQSSKSTESETRQTAEKSSTLLLLALLKAWKKRAPKDIEAKIGENPQVSVRVGKDQVYEGRANSPEIAAIPQKDVDYLKYATSLEQGYSHTDLNRDVEIKIGGHKVFEVVGGEVTRNQISPSQYQKISIDIPGVTAPKAEVQQPTQEAPQDSIPTAEAMKLNKFLIGMDSHIKSMPQPEQGQYEERLKDLIVSDKFADYKGKINELSTDLYGKSYDAIQQETQLQAGQASTGQELDKEQDQGKTPAPNQVAQPSPSPAAKGKPIPASKNMDLGKAPDHQGNGHKLVKPTEKEKLYRYLVGIKSHIHSMPQGEQAQYSEQLDSISGSKTYDECKDRVNDLSMALYGRSYDDVNQDKELEIEQADQGSGVVQTSEAEAGQASPEQGPDMEEERHTPLFPRSHQIRQIRQEIEGPPESQEREPEDQSREQETIDRPEPGSKEDVVDAARYIAKQMGESDYSGGKSYESTQYKIEIYGNDLKVFDHDGNKAIEIDQIGGVDSYQPTPELVGVLTESANELELQEMEHDTPELDVDAGMDWEIGDDD